MRLGPLELIIILAIVLLLVGSTAIPKLTKAIMQSKKDIENEFKKDDSDESSKKEE